MSHVRAIQARFPHFVNMFVFFDGKIVAINKTFTWHGQCARSLKAYMEETVWTESDGIAKYTNVDGFLKQLSQAPFI